MSKEEAEETDPSTEGKEDLGFTYLSTKSGIVFIRHNGRLASELRGADAETFLKKLEGISFSEEQQLMARVTGNYKHGNERMAGKHSRNR